MTGGNKRPLWVGRMTQKEDSLTQKVDHTKSANELHSLQSQAVSSGILLLVIICLWLQSLH